MNRFEVKNRTLPLRCEICHRADLFDAERSYCSRCNGVIDLEVFTRPLHLQKENRTELPANNSWLFALTLMQLIATLLAIALVFLDVETILVSGPLLSAIGLITSHSSWRRGILSGSVLGLSAPAISLICLILILGFGWGPAQAQEPLQFIALCYWITLLPLGLKNLYSLWVRKKGR